MKKNYAIYYVGFKILLRKRDEFLFLRTADRKHFDLPGGRIDGDENRKSFERIIAREVREEIGRSVKYKLGKPLFQFRRFLLKKKKYIFITVYEAVYFAGKIELSLEHSGYEWINPKKRKLKKEDFFNKEEYSVFKKHFKFL